MRAGNTQPQTTSMMRAALILALVSLNFLYCFVEDIYFAYRPPLAGQTAPFSLRSAHPLPPDTVAPPAGRAVSGGPSAVGGEAYRPGEVLIPFLKPLDEDDVARIEAFEGRIGDAKYHRIPLVAFISIFMVVFLGFFLFALPRAGYKRNISQRTLLVLLIVHGAILKATLLFTALPVEFLPFAALPLMVIGLHQGRVTAVGISLVAAALSSLFIGQTFETALSLVVVGLTAVMVSSKIDKRTDLILPSLLIGVVNAVLVAALSPDWPLLAGLLEPPAASGSGWLRLAGDPVLVRCAWAFGGGVVSGVLALLILPAIRASRFIASTFSLRRFSDLDHPLLKRLFTEAPGTYQHSMTVAYLAQSAGEAIGANPLLLRIGAYYHDIGKMSMPRNFIENQLNGENPHDALAPHESVAAILGHVDEGLSLAMEARLPPVVIDLIREHHGNQVLDFFYHKALKTQPKGNVREADYRYPGPKPQSAEAALLMIADAVEAASRSLKEPGRKAFQRLVRLIVLKRIADSQLSESGLDTRDIDTIIRTLVDALEASFHARIAYPWQQVQAAAPAAGPGIKP